MDAPFVGRAEELKRLAPVLEAAASGKGSILLVKGESGVGKTRFVLEATLRASGAFDLLAGRCAFQEAGDPYAAVTEPIVKYRAAHGAPARAADGPAPSMDGPIGLLGVTGSPLGAAVDDGAAGSMGLVGLYETTAAAAPLGAPRRKADDVDFAKERDRMFSAVVDVLRDLAGRKPLILFIDDLHWAQGATLQLLGYIARLIPDLPLLVAGAYRPEELERPAAGAGAGEAGRQRHPLKDALVRWRHEAPITEVNLARFTAAEGGAMAAAVLRVPAVPPEFSGKLFEQTEGTPLFIEELLRVLIADGALKVGQPPAKLDFGKVRIPQNVEDLLQARLAGLDPEDRKVVDTAAVVGESFELGLVGVVAGVAEDGMVEVIDRLEQAGLVLDSTRPAGATGDWYRFSHKMLREATYQALSSARRRLVHKRVAQSLEGRLKAARPEAVYALAHHYTLGQEPEKAMAFSLQAAQVARSTFAADEAMAHLQQVLGFLDRLPPDAAPADVRRRVITELAQLSHGKGDYGRASKWSVELEKVAREAGDRVGISNALRLRAHLDRIRGNWQSALKLYDEARGSGVEAGDLPATEEALLGFAEVQAGRSDFGPAETALRAMLESARGRKDSRNVARALVELGTIASARGEAQEAERSLASGIQELVHGTDPFLLAGAYWTLGEHDAKYGQWAKARDSYQRCRELATKTGDLHMRGRAMAMEAQAMARGGVPSDALKLCGDAFKLLARGSDKEGLCRVYQSYGVAYAASGELPKAAIHLQQGLNLAEDLDQPSLLALFLTDLGTVTRDRGDRKGALRVLRKAQGICERNGLVPILARLRTLVEPLEQEEAAGPPPVAPGTPKPPPPPPR